MFWFFRSLLCSATIVFFSTYCSEEQVDIRASVQIPTLFYLAVQAVFTKLKYGNTELRIFSDNKLARHNIGSFHHHFHDQIKKKYGGSKKWVEISEQVGAYIVGVFFEINRVQLPANDDAEFLYKCIANGVVQIKKINFKNSRDNRIVFEDANSGTQLDSDKKYNWDVRDMIDSLYYSVKSGNEIFSRTELTKMLKDCLLPSEQLQSVPYIIFSLKRLRMINLRKNELTSIPIELFDLQEIVECNLSHNKITTIPTQITKWAELCNLNLERNKLTAIPEDELSQLKQGCVINLRRNIDLKFSQEFLTVCSAQGVNIRYDWNQPAKNQKLQSLTQT